MAAYDILVGTVLGASEYVADALSETLSAKGHNVSIHLDPNVDEINPEAVWLICCSTHGAGDLPDNIQSFAKQLSDRDLSDINFMVVGLGDSSYDTYCNGAITLQNMMQQAGAKLAYKPIHIDVLHHPIPEDTAVEWLQGYLESEA